MDFKRTMGMTEFEKLVYLYDSGQLSDQQWQWHLQDPIFANYVKMRKGK